jgi:hypothetical protein
MATEAREDTENDKHGDTPNTEKTNYFVSVISVSPW